MKINIITVDTQTSGNIGAIARLCANFQVDKLIVVKPQCRINDKEVYKRAVDGKQYIDNIIKLEKLEDVRQYCDYLIALTGVVAKSSSIRNPLPIFEIADKLSQFDNGSIGLVLGPENVGLSNEQLKTCDISATIPLLSDEKSNRILNISHAASIALYELNRNKIISADNQKQSGKTLMNSSEKKYIMEYYDKITSHTILSGKIQEDDSRILFNSIISRALLNNKDGHLLMGIMRAILHAIEI